MSFKENDCQQLTLNDAVWGLTERENRMLQKSWQHILQTKFSH